MAPTYPPSGAAVEYPSPVSRRPSECFSEAAGSRRGSAAGFAAEMESKGQWQSIGSNSDSKSPLANFAFFKNLTEKKTTRGATFRRQSQEFANHHQMDNHRRGGGPSPTASRP